jgi:hypothetical protein
MLTYYSIGSSDGNRGKAEGIVREEFAEVYLVSKPVISFPFAVIAYPNEHMPELQDQHH